MGQSIYEKACLQRQPEFLQKKAKLSFEQTSNLMEKLKNVYSKKVMKKYKETMDFVFGKDGKAESKTFEEVVGYIKGKKLNEFDLDSFYSAISTIYDATYEEVRDYYEGKEYWMSISHLYLDD